MIGIGNADYFRSVANMGHMPSSQSIENSTTKGLSILLTKPFVAELLNSFNSSKNFGMNMCGDFFIDAIADTFAQKDAFGFEKALRKKHHYNHYEPQELVQTEEIMEGENENASIDITL
jgi:hypothetical protein